MCKAYFSNGRDQITKEKTVSKKSARTFNQVDDSKSDDELYISHVLRSRKCSYQMPCGASAKGRWELQWTAKPCKQIVVQRPTD